MDVILILSCLINTQERDLLMRFRLEEFSTLPGIWTLADCFLLNVV